MSATNASGVTFTHHRRRVVDDREKDFPSDCVQIGLDHTNAEFDVSPESCGSPYNCHIHTAARYFLMRNGLPESFVVHFRGFLKPLAPRIHVRISVSAILLTLLALSVFFKFVFFSHGDYEAAAIAEKEVVIIHNFRKEFSSNAQRAVFDEGSSINFAPQKRQMKEFPVSSLRNF